MIFFNKHAKLKADLAILEARCQALQNQIEYLVRTIRDMDQEIFNMSQRTSWDGMRPHFNKLHDEMIARKVEESKRIGELIRSEVIDTYKPKALPNV